MYRIIVHYGTPEDTETFDAYYTDVHIPLTLKMPHLKGFEISKGKVDCSDEARPVYLTAILTYANQADLEASISSEAGQDAVADVGNFAPGGLTLVTFETEELI